ncbi:MAG: (deoxy)nucleoside triphosphate pyrophosphohydrolase [Candidatus Omnitrophica bacterium]|nr:(deoxy)nucleoside triphosphate pyrophosphohydrolase [Candidatus Omnitrophota bacterium]
MRNVAIALILQEPQVLITQRRPQDSFALHWEFPGGKCEDNETLEECIVREMREEIGVTVTVEEDGPEAVHEYPDQTVRLVSFWCRIVSGAVTPLEVADFRWVASHELDRYRFPPASTTLIEAVRQRLKIS